MDQLRRTIVLAMAVLMALTALAASAQDEAAGPLDDISQLDGIVAAVSRSWAIDSTATPAASPVAVAGPDRPDPDGAIFLIGVVMEFDAVASAERAFALHRDYTIGQQTELDEADDVVANAPIAGLGDNAHGFDIGSQAEDADLFFRFVMAHDGRYVYIVTLAAADAEATAGADRLAAYLVDEGEPSPDETTFSADGSSTGGAWGFFPAPGHASLGGLVPSMDDPLYPVPDGGA